MADIAEQELRQKWWAIGFDTCCKLLGAGAIVIGIVATSRSHSKDLEKQQTRFLSEQKGQSQRLEIQLKAQQQQFAADQKAQEDRLSKQLTAQQQQANEDRNAAEDRLSKQLIADQQRAVDDRKASEDRMSAQSAAQFQQLLTQLADERQRAADERAHDIRKRLYDERKAMCVSVLQVVHAVNTAQNDAALAISTASLTTVQADLGLVADDTLYKAFVSYLDAISKWSQARAGRPIAAFSPLSEEAVLSSYRAFRTECKRFVNEAH